ncbi:MAG: haloacid dehalogenase type II [Gammaproteobacteria bacterium]
MTPVLAFDVYGTLIDTSGIARSLSARGISDAAAFAARWRDKQLEYTFRRALMRRYAPFSECTKTALDFVCAERAAELSDSDRKDLMAEYAVLPAFADAAPALSVLAESDARMFAFSNGEDAAVRRVLKHNRLAEYFADIVSVEDARSFKPDPQVYAHFLRRAGAAAEHTWLVSGNPFDIIGARESGWKTAWVNRGAALFDPWPQSSPSAVVASLAELPQLISAR